MRISTMQQFNQGVGGMLRNQANVNATQNQVSTGVKFNSPADDPVAATKILLVEQDLGLREQFQKNIDFIDNRLKLEESTLFSIEDALIRVRELTVQAGDGSYSEGDWRAVAVEMEAKLNEIVSYMNTQDQSGDYIFSGFKGKTQAFELTRGGFYEYQGDEGQRKLPITSNSKIETGDNGKELFMDIQAVNQNARGYPDNNNSQAGDPPAFITKPIVFDDEAYADFYYEDVVITFNSETAITPNGYNFTVTKRSDGGVVNGLERINYMPGQDITYEGVKVKISGEPRPGDKFYVDSSEKAPLTDTIQDMVDTLFNTVANPDSQENLTKMISRTLNNLDAAITSVSDVHSKIGARFNTIESTKGFHQDLDLASNELLADLRDVDFAEALSRLSLQSFLLEASQNSYARIQSISLINSI